MLYKRRLLAIGNTTLLIDISFSVVKQFNWPELMLPIRTMQKIKLRPVGLCYLNSVEHRSGRPLYRSTPSLFKFEQVNWLELMLPIKLFQFKICELVVTEDM